MQTRFSNFIQHLLYGCFFIAICAGGATIASMLEGAGKIEWRLLLAVMGATLVHYNLHYLFQNSALQVNTARTQWSRTHRTHQFVYAGLGCLLAIPYATKLDWDMIRLWMPVILIGITYSFPVMPFKIRRWKEQGILKWLFLSLTWTIVTAWIPLASMELTWAQSWKPLLLRLELLLALCWLFDMRDRQLDLAHGVRTLPVRLGWQRSKQIALGWVALYLVTVGMVYPVSGSDGLFWAHVMTALALGAVTLGTNERKSDFFYLFWVDGLLLWQFLCVLGTHLARNEGY